MPPSIDRAQFEQAVVAARSGSGGRTLMVPVALRLLGDQLTPVLAYRRLVAADERTAPSFLFESVEGGDRVGRRSLLGAAPALEVLARGHDVEIIDHRAGTREEQHAPDPLALLPELSARFQLVPAGDHGLPESLLGGWVGYASYDTVRYAEPERLGFDAAPPDDRGLPDLHFSLYDSVVVFDHVDKVVHALVLARVEAEDEPGEAYDAACARLGALVAELETHARPLPSGDADAAPDAPGAVRSNMTREQHAAAIERAKEYIRAGDVFQVVIGQRFERSSMVDPFDVYRALRVVNPSPYMVYLQARGCILVASSPEILCRVRAEGDAGQRIVTNRPLAGTRRRGSTPEEDRALEAELLADSKEVAEHVMLVDLGRNDVGRVAEFGSVRLDTAMAIERYSHVMHISSTVTGALPADMDCWDALRSTLPVGTISGAPKIRAMQVIDELEPVRRGPYGGGFGWVGLTGEMDVALALRTMVVPTGDWLPGEAWTYHLQASGGIVFDSEPDAEYEETRNKAAALVRAIDLAEGAFGNASRHKAD